MNATATKLKDAYTIERSAFKDERGWFYRMYDAKLLAELGITKPINQINHSHTVEVGTVRGMHFQHAPAAEVKIITCIKGCAYDVIVDLRKTSPTYLQWVAIELDAEKQNTVVVPEGFAHGFQVLKPNTELVYLHTAAYAKEHEGGVRYDDPALNIQWPMAAIGLSPRDQAHPLITPAFEGIKV